MPRAPRVLLDDQTAVYHVMSRTALDGFPFGPADNDRLLALLRFFSSVYFCQILGFALMGNHFHLLVRMTPSNAVSSADVLERFHRRYGEDAHPSLAQIETLREKWTSLSEFMRELKQTFSRYYNKRHSRRGTLWGERFKSVLVEDGRTLVHCLAYIDLNPVRAGLVERPEDYRWCSLGYHAQTGNRGGLLSSDFGMVEWGIDDEAERLRLYRQFVYESGAVETIKGKSIDPDIVERARQNDYEYSTTDRFVMRTRWFTDAGIIGSKAFIEATAKRLGLPFSDRRIPREVSGVGFFSLKRLSESL